MNNDGIPKFTRLNRVTSRDRRVEPRLTLINPSRRFIHNAGTDFSCIQQAIQSQWYFVLCPQDFRSSPSFCCESPEELCRPPQNSRWSSRIHWAHRFACHEQIDWRKNVCRSCAMSPFPRSSSQKGTHDGRPCREIYRSVYQIYQWKRWTLFFVPVGSPWNTSHQPRMSEGSRMMMMILLPVVSLHDFWGSFWKGLQPRIRMFVIVYSRLWLRWYPILERSSKQRLKDM